MMQFNGNSNDKKTHMSHTGEYYYLFCSNVVFKPIKIMISDVHCFILKKTTECHFLYLSNACTWTKY